MERITIEFNPTIYDLEEIKEWALCLGSSWSCINQAYLQKKLIITKYGNKTVSFLAYKEEEVIIFISLAQTKPELRNKGFMKKMVYSLLQHYQKTNYKAFYLYCSPEESQYFWKKIGFQYCPEGYGDNNFIYMFKIFGNVEQVIDFNSESTEDSILIWDWSYPKLKEPAKWTCDLNFKDQSDELIKPILFFGRPDWQIKIIRNG